MKRIFNILSWVFMFGSIPCWGLGVYFVFKEEYFFLFSVSFMIGGWISFFWGKGFEYLYKNQ